MSRYDDASEELRSLARRRLITAGIAAILLVVVAWQLVGTPVSLPVLIALALSTFLLGRGSDALLPFLLPSYRRLRRSIARLEVEVFKIVENVEAVYGDFPQRKKGQQFKVAYSLSGRRVHDLERALAVGMRREAKEVFVTVFVRDEVAARVTASIGSPYRCWNADDPSRWASYITRLECSELRQYHNHPVSNNRTEPSRPDLLTSKQLRSVLGEHADKLRSFIIYWNAIGEWRIIEHNTEGQWWPEFEFDASKGLAAGAHEARDPI